jgi:hypothetical protein
MSIDTRYVIRRNSENGGLRLILFLGSKINH